MRGLVHSALDEASFQPGLLGKASGNIDGCAGEVYTGCHRTTSDEREGIFANMALQVEDALPRDIANFCGLDRVQGILAGPKGLDPVEAGGIARVNLGAR